MPVHCLPSSFSDSGWVSSGHPPSSVTIWLTSYRGDDDYFSSDLPDEKVRSIWQRVKKPILIVPSEKDQYVPQSVDFGKLLAKWKSVCPVASDRSALIPGANHTVDPPSSREWLAERVVGFLKDLEQPGQTANL